MQNETPTVQPSYITVGGLRIATYRFAPPPGHENQQASPVLLAHGFVDSGATFAPVATILARATGRVIYSFDWRGHGRSDWIGPGGYYHFFDYVGELDGVVRSLIGDQPFHLVGHSMGGVVSTYWSGLNHVSLQSLAVLEGVGIPGSPLEDTYPRMQDWLATLAAGRKPARQYANKEEITERMARRAPRLDADMLAFLVEQLAQQQNGRWSWRFDPFHRTRGPYVFQEEIWQTFAKQIQVPVRLVQGSVSNMTPSLDYIARRNRVLSAQAPAEIPGADHMMHWSHPEPLASLLQRFFTEVEAAQ